MLGQPLLPGPLLTCALFTSWPGPPNAHAIPWRGIDARAWAAGQRRRQRPATGTPVGCRCWRPRQAQPPPVKQPAWQATCWVAAAQNKELALPVKRHLTCLVKRHVQEVSPCWVTPAGAQGCRQAAASQREAGRQKIRPDGLPVAHIWPRIGRLLTAHGTQGNSQGRSTTTGERLVGHSVKLSSHNGQPAARPASHARAAEAAAHPSVPLCSGSAS